MSETNIFSGDPANEVVPPAIPSATIPPDVSEFVGEGKKYKSIEDALKSVPNAQRHITQIEEENARLKAEVASRQSVEEILTEIKSGIKPIETQAGAVLDPNVIADIVSKQIQLSEKQKEFKGNTEKVVSVFQTTYGDKAEEVFIKVAADSGLTIDALNKLAATSPNAVLILAGLGAKQTNTLVKPNSTVNTETFAKGQGNEELSAKIPKGATTKQVAQAWKNAGEIVKRNLS